MEKLGSMPVAPPEPVRGLLRQAGGGRGPGASLQEACAEFESLFLNLLLKGMRATVPQSGLLSGGKAEALTTSLLDTELARRIAHSRSVGLAAYFQEHLKKEPGYGEDPAPEVLAGSDP